MRTPEPRLLFILATLLIDGIGIGIVFPIMPELMTRVGAADLAAGSVWAGLLMSAYAAAQFVFAPVVGSLSDSYGRKFVLLTALFLLALDYVVMALAQSLWLLLVMRTLAGVAGATYTTATAYITDITEKGQRAERFGLIGAAFGIGFVIGPAIGGLAAGLSLSAPFWVAAALALANFGFGLVVLPESLLPENRRPFGRRDLNAFGAIWRAFRLPGLMLPLACIFVFEFANMVYPTLWAFWGREVFGWSALIVGLSLSVYGVLIVIVQAGVMPVAVRILGEYRVALLGLGVSVMAMVGFGFAASAWVVAVFLPLAALSDLVPPTLSALAANATDEDKQGLLQGVIGSLGAISAVGAPILFTGVFGAFTGHGAIYYLPGAPFLLAAGMVLAILPLIWRAAHRV